MSSRLGWRPSATTPRIAPRSRRCRVRRRVSTPSSTGTPAAASQSSRLRVERQLDGWRESSRTTTPRHLRPLRLHVLGVHPVVPDHRRGHHYDLAEVARVGEGLLIPGEVGGEDHFPERRVDGTRGGSGEPGAVLEQNESGAIGHPVTPRSIGLTCRVASGPRPPASAGAGAGAPVAAGGCGARLRAGRGRRRRRPSWRGRLARGSERQRGAGLRRRRGAGPEPLLQLGGRAAAPRHEREHQREQHEDPAAPPRRLGEDGDGLAPAEHGVGGAAAERSEPAALAGLQQDHDREQERVEDRATSTET